MDDTEVVAPAPAPRAGKRAGLAAEIERLRQTIGDAYEVLQWVPLKPDARASVVALGQAIGRS